MSQRLTFKSTLLGGTLVIFLLLAYSEIYSKKNEHKDILVRSNKNERRISSIDAQELQTILKSAGDKKYTGENIASVKLPPGINKFNISKIYQQRMQRSRDRLKNGRYNSGGYASRTLIEDLKLPEEWSLSPTLEKTLAARKEHVKQICQKYDLDKRTVSYQPNAWEYMVNEEYNLMWCPVFKAASSTWMFNFNLLSGYTENFLYGAKESPVALARKKYPRLKTVELDDIVSRSSKPLTFMITRHPFDRLVSAFRDKIQGGKRYYKKIYDYITSRYPHLADESTANEIEKIKDPLEKVKMRRKRVRMKIPSFRQFVQYLIDCIKTGKQMDEHWAPMNNFCTPCLIDIDVFAKVETLEEDGNYIIFSSGIEHVIKPKRINRSKKGPTNNVVKKFMCQLSPRQQIDLVWAYKLDLELFQYDYEQLFEDCSSVLI